MFEVKGEKPQWQVIYDRIYQMQIGDVVTHEELRSLLPDAPLGSVMGALHRAVEVLQVDRKRSLQNVRTVGYRMIHANEHADYAKKRTRRAYRQTRKGIGISTNADRTMLSSSERRRIDAIEFHQRKHADMLRRIEERQDRTETRVALTEKDAVQLSDKIDSVVELLQRHGIK